MDRLTGQFLAQGGIHQLMLTHQAQPGKGRGADLDLQVKVSSSAFAGLSLVRQHQLVYAALRQELASEAIHALALETSVPA